MSRNMWIEGFGDDAVFAISAFFGLFVPLTIMVLQK